MPQGFTFGDNRFSLLGQNTGPGAKRKKKDNQATFVPFPQLPDTKQANPKYIVMESIAANKPLSKFSCFGVYKSIKVISKDVDAVTELRDGNLLLFVRNKTIAEKFISTTELPGICKIKVRYHENLNATKGTIFAPYLNNIPEQEIVDELSDQGVTGVYKFQKKEGDKFVPSGVVLLTFDLFNLPKRIDISWRSVNVREYIPSPMRCKSCQKLGHTQKYCKNTPICVNCNLPPHLEQSCTRIQCANCSLEHASSSRDCTKFIQAKDILCIKIRNKCSMREALKKYRETIPNAPPSPITKSYSSVARETISTTPPSPIQKSPSPVALQQKQSKKNNEKSSINSSSSKLLTQKLNQKYTSLPETSKPIEQSNLTFKNKTKTQFDITDNSFTQTQFDITENSFTLNTLDSKTPLLPSFLHDNENHSESDEDFNTFPPINIDEDL